jgi:hypothetical protein
VSEIFETDRSGILEFQKCPRSRFYSRHFNGKGIEKLRKSLPLVFGSAFHIGTDPLLRGEGVELAVDAALTHLDQVFAVEGVDLEEKQTAYAVEEQRAIAEGLLRAWWIEKGQRFLDEFEVLEFEQEGRAVLKGRSTKTCPNCSAQSSKDAAFCGGCGQEILHESFQDHAEIVLMFRPDALVRERLTGDYYIVSWKTASTFGAYTINSIQTDMQSMSEVFGVEQANGMNIEGVLYLFAIKGQRKFDDYLGFKTQNTPLAYGWMKLGNTPEEADWSWQYSWQTEEINSKTGKPVKTTLGKGWKKVPIWSDYPGGVKAWVEALAAREISPRHINPFESIFPESMPISRRGDEIESWRRQVVSQEGRVRQRAKAVELARGDEAMLDAEFPQHTQNCFSYNSPCAFFDICFKPAVKADPLGSGLYRIRQANHPEHGGNDE